MGESLKLTMESQPQNPEFRNNPENFKMSKHIRVLVLITLPGKKDSKEPAQMCRRARVFIIAHKVWM